LDVELLKDRVVAKIDTIAGLLIEVSHQLHAHPELRFEEHLAHRLLTTTLADHGLRVQESAFGLPTAFVAEAGHAGPVIAVLCEYDALPGIGHACGHNIIAAAGIGAGIAAASVAEVANGRVVVLGTPAEEGGQGKHRMAERGAFDGVEAALIVHPASADLRSIDGLATAFYEVRYSGRAAHAAARPEEGLNALDAAVLGYISVAALRQHILPTERIHGIFTKAGEWPNIVPQDTAAVYSIRSPTVEQVDKLLPRVIACLKAGAVAAGCEIVLLEIDRCADVLTNEVLIDLFSSNMTRLGRDLKDPRVGGGVVGSTDFGRISHLVPSIHPMIKISPPNVSIHEESFARFAVSADGDQAVLDGAKAMAMTLVDLWTDHQALESAWASFHRQVGTSSRQT
jgi:amidohydrolase